ncbi:MAG TPA: tRNA 2-thiouridine(34) synthase MnmA [Desulfocapsa sulfexigens]|nr:tRNA 2-thiouridine(34) synthase MnmA [Desulfocapsa sulfexigens]
MLKERIKMGIAMSGGVDSTACALLLREKYDVHAFFMKLSQPDIELQIKRVKKITGQCGIPLQIIDLQAAFEKIVLRYFSTAYRNGRTPNPCMICNREIKFGLFMDAILASGMSRVATGHYAKIIDDDDCFLLQQGNEETKDQSYFLARLSQKQLAQVEFPLGEMTKEQVYNFVEEHGFTDFRGQESQDVCFLGTDSIGRFLETRISAPAQSGEIVSTDGQILGRHKGIYNYTIGQRRGLGIAAATPLYVIRIDAENNRIIAGKNEDLFRDSVEIEDVLWNCDRHPDPDHTYRVRIRYGHKGQEARITPVTDTRFRITFKEKQRAVTPGQFSVIYDQGLVLGSGEIQ